MANFVETNDLFEKYGITPKDQKTFINYFTKMIQKKEGLVFSTEKLKSQIEILYENLNTLNNEKKTLTQNIEQTNKENSNLLQLYNSINTRNRIIEENVFRVSNKQDKMTTCMEQCMNKLQPETSSHNSLLNIFRNRRTSQSIHPRSRGGKTKTLNKRHY